MLPLLVIACIAAMRLRPSVPECSVIPKPQCWNPAPGHFLLSAETPIIAEGPARATAEFLARRLRTATGFELPVLDSSRVAPDQSAIRLQAEPASFQAAEAYRIQARTNRIEICGSDEAGLFYGAQTLLQLLPPQVFRPAPVRDVAWTIRCCSIEDAPRFSWRGAMLDSSRHFFDKAEVERVLDLMALHKLNVFHWHLSDDQGWRLEIKKYPALTQTGAWRKRIGFGLDPRSSRAYGPDGKYGGYYTQKDVREVVAYARERHIAIVPEIELPGHASAILAAYPEFGCTGQVYDLDVAAGIYSGVLCAGSERAFAFVQDVLSEVMDLFPGQYIHVGGDEVSKSNWRQCVRCQERMKDEGLGSERRLEGYFMRRVQQMLQARGRTLIGWSEIAQTGLPAGAAVMDWLGAGEDVAAAGHDVVMTPASFCYLDYAQQQRNSEPGPGGFTPLSRVYGFEPVSPSLTPAQARHILGTQANLWTEYIPNISAAEQRLFPRLCALAEVAWSNPRQRNWPDFRERLQEHFQRLRELGVNFHSL
jgi:hexosaminidase